MKKFLVVLLACVMVFAFASSAFAADEQIADFTDVADQSYAAQVAIYRLAALGVLEGYGDGTYLPNNNITRAELTKIAVYLSGKSDMKGLMQAAIGQFSDVTSAHWANGWINIASQDGVVQGYPGGYFGPERQITQAEVITMILRIVGYTDTLNGEWPYDYLRAADTLGILDDITLRSLASTQDGSAPATRAEVAILANAVLELDVVKYDANSISYLMDASVYDQDATRDKTYRFLELVSLSNDNKFVATGYDLLDKAFDAYAVDGFRFASADFEDTYYENAAWGYEDFDDSEFALFDYDYDEYAVASKYYIMGSDFPGLENALANVIVQDDEVIFVEKTSSEALVAEVKKGSEGRNIQLDGTTVKYASDEDGMNSMNYSAEEYFDGIFYDEDIFNNFENLATYGKAYLNKDGDLYDFVHYEFDDGLNNGAWYRVANYANTGLLPQADLVIEISDDDEEMVFQHGKEIALDDADDFLVYKNGEFVKFEDIEEGDVVYRFDLDGFSSDQEFLVVASLEEAELVNARKGEFKLDETYFRFYAENQDDEYGYDYHFDPKLATYYGLEGLDELDPFETRDKGDSDVAGYTVLDEAYGEDVLYGLSYDFTKLAFIISDVKVPAKYGVVTDYITRSNDRLTEITLFTADGKEVAFEFDGNAYYDDEFTYGDLVELSLNKNGKVNVLSGGAPDLKVLEYENPLYEDLTIGNTDYENPYEATLATYALLGDQADYTYDIGRNRTIYFDGDGEVGRRLNESAVIFDVRTNSEGKFRDVKLIKPSDILASDDYSAEMLLYKPNDFSISVMYVVNGSERFAKNYGIASDYEYDSTRGSVKLDGTKTSFHSAFNALNDAIGWANETAFVGYELDGQGRITVIRPIVSDRVMALHGLSAINKDWDDRPIIGIVQADLKNSSTKLEIRGWDGENFSQNQNLDIQDTELFYDFSKSKPAAIKQNEVEAGDFVYLVMDGEYVEYLFVLNASSMSTLFQNYDVVPLQVGDTLIYYSPLGIREFATTNSGAITNIVIGRNAEVEVDGDIVIAKNATFRVGDDAEVVFNGKVTYSPTGNTLDDGKVVFAAKAGGSVKLYEDSDVVYFQVIDGYAEVVGGTLDGYKLEGDFEWPLTNEGYGVYLTDDCELNMDEADFLAADFNDNGMFVADENTLLTLNNKVYRWADTNEWVVGTP